MELILVQYEHQIVLVLVTIVMITVTVLTQHNTMLTTGGVVTIEREAASTAFSDSISSQETCRQNMLKTHVHRTMTAKL